MGIVHRLRHLEASLTPEQDPADAGARDRLVAKLAQMAERHRAAREREEGLQPDLGELSYVSLLALVMSYPYGEVPPEVEPRPAQCLRKSCQALPRVQGGRVSIKGRIRRLEEERRNSPEPPCEKCGGRFIYEELGAYDAALSRALKSGEFAEEDWPILERVEWLYEEVADELTSAS